MKYENFMYYLPAIILGLATITIVTWKQGIFGLMFWLIIGIGLILIYFWCRYWLKKKHEKEKLENGTIFH